MRSDRLLGGVLVLGLALWLGTSPTWAVIIHLKDRDEPIRGYLVRESDSAVIVAEVRPDGTTVERAVWRSEIRELSRFVSEAQLAALRPDHPAAYRAYADDLSAMREDPDAHVTALRLYQIAAHLDPARLGRSCVLGMIPLARSEAEERRFRAMAYLLDPAHDVAILQRGVAESGRSSGVDPEQAQAWLEPLRALRQGHPHRALALARRYKLRERLPLLGDSITYDEFEQACGGDDDSHSISRSLLERIVRLEIQWAAGPEDAEDGADARRAARLPWSRLWQLGDVAPAPSLTLETLTEFDPRQACYRHGRWEP